MFIYFFEFNIVYISIDLDDDDGEEEEEDDKIIINNKVKWTVWDVALESHTLSFSLTLIKRQTHTHTHTQ